MERITDLSSATIKATPPAVVTFSGLALNEWVAVATIIYIVIQAAHLLWKWRRDANADTGNGDAS